MAIGQGIVTNRVRGVPGSPNSFLRSSRSQAWPAGLVTDLLEGAVKAAYREDALDIRAVENRNDEQDLVSIEFFGLSTVYLLAGSHLSP